MAETRLLKLAVAVAAVSCGTCANAMDESSGAATSVFAKENLVAWCIVPFDASRRGPEQRAEMLDRLGIKRVAYDWRQEHVPTFEQEILAYQEHGLEYFAFWSWHPAMEPLIKKYDIHPQVWEVNHPDPPGNTRQEKIENAAKHMLPRVELTKKLGCKLGLYNHGGWGGEPENLVAVTQWLRQNAQADHVGIIYNFHHGHEHIQDFATALADMKPLLFCLNINGMNSQANPKILPVGDGEHDREMLRIVLKSGYSGPIGVLDHRPELDSEKSLLQNLNGLEKVLAEIGDEAALKTYK
jgi:sugar phosphate isomerase/epimerase